MEKFSIPFSQEKNDQFILATKTDRVKTISGDWREYRVGIELCWGSAPCSLVKIQQNSGKQQFICISVIHC